MKKTTLSSILVVVVLVAVAVVAKAQQRKKVHRIGYLSPFDPVGESSRSEPIRQALRDLGYIEGQNITTEYRYSEGKRDRTPELAAELVRLKVDIIVISGGTIWVQAAKNATKTIPIVMVGGGLDPVESGLVESLARPGGNVTGITNLNPELGGKRLELLKEAVPKLSRVAGVYDPDNPASVLDVKDVLPAAARTLRFSLGRYGLGTVSRRYSLLNKERPDGLYVLGGPLMNANQKRIVGLALKSRLPSMYVRREFVDAGGLMSYGPDRVDMNRRAASFVDKILKGAKPADLPVEQPKKFEFVVNLKTAKQISLTIPPNVLARADKVIK